MKRLAILTCMLALAGCAAAPLAPPGTVVPAERLAQAVQPGVTTKATLLAQLGATSSFRFDSGYEIWRYLTPGPAGPVGEFVVVIDPQGVVSKARSAPAPYQTPPKK
ncbi:hypothetical protein [Massilia eurypsychrophila]|nr:hypothetical protein [Massilia eurypsychrophila]